MWAGIECTYNRVGDNYYDQLNKNGHHERVEDLEIFANLGIERIRYPCLWEKVSEHKIDHYNWKWLDARIAKLQELKLEPIAGLLHHGSGPRFTALIDPEFPEKFATYARAFAERYPEISDYTPVNEPLTTARFSGLYGVWFPHHNTDRSFIRALYNEVAGTIRAMQEIRKVRPEARLIQTDDLGRATSTEPLIYQRDFENNRRWLTYDMLSGFIDRFHPMYDYLIHAGLTDREIAWLAENPCPPDIIGINHYLLSNRFLDHNEELYPVEFRGGNGRHRYADLGAVDVGVANPPTPESVFMEAWERYKIPLAITEVHISGPREAQMRWLKEIWDSCVSVNEKGGQVKAVTAWGLLGHFDWNSLCVQSNDHYESGIYDVRSPSPRPTILAEMIEGLAKNKNYEHPVLDQPGWWHTPRRILFNPPATQILDQKPSGQPILITGATGTLGRAFARICELRGIPYRLTSRQEMDLAEPSSVHRVLDEIKPWAVINTAGYVKVDLAEQEQERCFRENVLAPEILAKACSERKIRFVTFSSDLVFNGELNSPYVESHPVEPLNTYGRTKAESEQKVLLSLPEALVVRTSSFFGPWDEHNFVTQTLKQLISGAEVKAASDVKVSPTYVPDLVNACIDLLIDGEKGILHLTNKGAVSWAELAKKAASIALEVGSVPKTSDQLIIEKSMADLNLPAIRPRFSALDSERMAILPSLDDALARYFSQLEIKLSNNFEQNKEGVLL
jgi:dTDP-4-dehydrorhamnose reductase